MWIDDVSERSVMDAQCVDIQNDRLHKGYIKITLHVPVERGQELNAMMQKWPTYTDPVPVALARLNFIPQPAKEKQAEIVPASDSEHPARALPQRVGRICADIRFRRWCWDRKYVTAPQEDLVASWVRERTKVISRAEILPGTEAEQAWNLIESAYLLENQ